ncbi:MAG: LemA family protein [Lachnospiraceae bacterium]|jgi:LemA protein|nr:LemA family protein [Lachnospiraceae bacterium]
MAGYIVLVIIFVIIVSLAAYVASAYNSLVKSRNRVDAQWAQIDVQLTKRADLIPNLVETVKGYAAHEKEIFEGVTAARNALESAATPGQAITAHDRLLGKLGPVFAVAEAYPELKSDKNFIELQAALAQAEEKIAYARQFYNDTVMIYKDKTQQFPSSVIAGMFHFRDVSYFAPAEEKKADVAVDFK